MDSFQLHGRVIADHRRYTESFIHIRDDFYEVDYLPENDRVGCTIHPKARKEILKRLLQLNHKLYAEEEVNGLHRPQKAVKKTEAKGEEQRRLL